jgi:hypothetical protein
MNESYQDSIQVFYWNLCWIFKLTDRDYINA